MLGRNKPCPDCDFAVIEDDLFCGSCGVQLFDASVKPDRIFVYLEPGQTEPVEIPLNVNDDGWGHPVIVPERLPEWLSFHNASLLRVEPSALVVLDLPEKSVIFRVKDTDVSRTIAVRV